MSRDFLSEAGLTNARLAGQHHQASVTSDCCRQRRAQQPQLTLASDESFPGL
jgi:hypothetical protein